MRQYDIQNKGRNSQSIDFNETKSSLKRFKISILDEKNSIHSSSDNSKINGNGKAKAPHTRQATNQRIISQTGNRQNISKLLERRSRPLSIDFNSNNMNLHNHISINQSGQLNDTIKKNYNWNSTNMNAKNEDDKAIKKFKDKFIEVISNLNTKDLKLKSKTCSNYNKNVKIKSDLYKFLPIKEEENSKDIHLYEKLDTMSCNNGMITNGNNDNGIEHQEKEKKHKFAEQNKKIVNAFDKLNLNPSINFINNPNSSINNLNQSTHSKLKSILSSKGKIKISLQLGNEKRELFREKITSFTILHSKTRYHSKEKKTIYDSHNKRHQFNNLQPLKLNSFEIIGSNTESKVMNILALYNKNLIVSSYLFL